MWINVDAWPAAQAMRLRLAVCHARRTLVTLNKIERLEIIPVIFICGFPGARRIIQKAPQFANEEEAPVNVSLLETRVSTHGEMNYL